MKTIVTAGKGGTGKSTLLSILLVEYLLPQMQQRVLVVDADPHQSLTLLLSRQYGFQSPVSLGELKRNHHSSLRSGAGLDDMSRDDLAALLIEQSLVRLPKAALLVMGPNNLPGCQCIVNSLLDRALDALQENFDLVIVDNEAGLEHIGRHHQSPIDILLLLATCQPLDMDVAMRILQHANLVKREIHHSVLIINKMRQAGSKNTLTLPKVDHQITMPYSIDLEEGNADGYWHSAAWDLFKYIQTRLEEA